MREEPLKETKIQPSVIDHITHDIVNQLSVISLCCCELRNSVGEKVKSDELKEFKRIENAVQNAADMIHRLKTVVQGVTALREPIEAWNAALNQAEAGDNFYAALSRFLYADKIAIQRNLFFFTFAASLSRAPHMLFSTEPSPFQNSKNYQNFTKI